MEGVSARHVSQGEVRCIVGFIPTAIVVRSKGKLLGKKAQIIEFYKDYDNVACRRRDNQNKGVAKYRLLDHLLEYD